MSCGGDESEGEDVVGCWVGLGGVWAGLGRLGSVQFELNRD